MAVTINWPTKVINVPRADMTLIQASPEIRELDTDAFRLELKALEADEGMPFLDTHSHNTTVTVGGVTLARVIEIINGYTVTFEDGQYAVNLVGSNNNISDVANVNQVSIRSANSAGLTYSDAINKQSFQGAIVYVDTENGLAGTVFPRGTPSDPVNNYTDAKSIGDTNGYDNFHLEGVMNVPSGVTLSGQGWEGDSPLHTDFNFTQNPVFKFEASRMSLGGVMQSGTAYFKECLIKGLTGFQGSMRECHLSSVVEINSQSTGITSLDFCSSYTTGQQLPILDFNGASGDGKIHYYAGGVEIRNFNKGANLSIDILAGHVKLHGTCTSGTVIVRGNAKLTDNSSGIVVDATHLINQPVDEINKVTKLIPATL